MMEGSDTEAAAHAAAALEDIAPAEERAIPRLRLWLSSPPSPLAQKVARTYLQKLGKLPADTAGQP
jgi:hypothetical protein